jgi:hypothetical protein
MMTDDRNEDLNKCLIERFTELGGYHSWATMPQIVSNSYIAATFLKKVV